MLLLLVSGSLLRHDDRAGMIEFRAKDVPDGSMKRDVIPYLLFAEPDLLHEADEVVVILARGRRLQRSVPLACQRVRS
jgi:hypothetical protein